MSSESMKFAPNPAAGPQPLLLPILEGEPYPVAALGPLQAAVEAVQGMTLAPIALPAQSALALASLAVQGFANVETLDSISPLSIYALTIARSGERKTSCDSKLMVGLADIEQELAQTQRETMQQWENDAAVYKGERDKILSEIKNNKGDKKTGAQADLDALGPPPLAPPSTDRIVSEPTFEGLTRLYANGSPSLGIFSDEGGQFLGGFAMSKDNRQKTLAALNNLWGGAAIKRTRAGEPAISLHNRRLAMHLMVQPGVARAFMADPMGDDTGFLPRFLMTEPPSTIGSRFQRDVRRDEASLDAFTDRLKNILKTEMPMDEETRALQPRKLALSQGTRELLVAYADEVEGKQAKDGVFAGITGYASKAAEQACRIAGVLTLWSDPDAPCITEREMVRGISLSRFYLGEALRLSNVAANSAEFKRAEKLHRWLLEKWQYTDIVPSEVMKNFPTSDLRNGLHAKAALVLLEQHGCLAILGEGTIVRDQPRKLAYRIL